MMVRASASARHRGGRPGRFLSPLLQPPFIFPGLSDYHLAEAAAPPLSYNYMYRLSSQSLNRPMRLSRTSIQGLYFSFTRNSNLARVFSPGHSRRGFGASCGQRSLSVPDRWLRSCRSVRLSAEPSERFWPMSSGRYLLADTFWPLPSRRYLLAVAA